MALNCEVLSLSKGKFEIGNWKLGKNMKCSVKAYPIGQSINKEARFEW